MNIKKLFIFFIVLAIPFISLLGAFRLTVFNMYFYEEQFNKYEPHIENAVDITADMLYFLKNNEAGKEYISDFNAEEQEHLVEVRQVIRESLLVFYAAIAIAIISLVSLYFADKKGFITNSGFAFFNGGLFSAVLITLFLLLVLFGFDSIFSYFHQILFTTTWQFPSDYLLVTLLPIKFFTGITTKIIFGAYAASALFLITGFYFANKEKYLNKFAKSKK